MSSPVVDPAASSRPPAPAPVVYLAGDLDMAAAHAPVELGLRRLDEITGQTLIVDLSGVTFIDSSGLGGLVQLSNLAAARGVTVYLRNPNPRAVSLLRLSGLDSVLPQLPARSHDRQPGQLGASG